MSANSAESGRPTPQDTQVSSLDEMMTRRRFIGKAVMAASGSVALGGVSTAFWEGRKTHIDSDFEGATAEEAAAMRSYDKRQWKRAFNRILVAGAGLMGVAIGGGIVLGHSETDRDEHTTTTGNQQSKDIFIASQNSY